MRLLLRASAIAGLIVLAPAGAGALPCPGNAKALGTSRVLTIDPSEHSRIGTAQYDDSLPLADKEIVLTFDDGPMPPYTRRVLEILAHNCVRANFFLIGRMARGYPELARRVFTDGHVIGTHTENHPLGFGRLSIDEARKEIETGIASVADAIGTPDAVAPFFRFPGLLRSDAMEAHLRDRGMTIWSTDITGDDWKHISAREVVQRVLARLDARGRGIILLHDIQPATLLALPVLLRELKARGYKVVQVAPARRKPATDPAPIVAAAPPPATTAAESPPRQSPRALAALAPRTQPRPAATFADAPRAPAAATVPAAAALATQPRPEPHGRTETPQAAPPQPATPQPAETQPGTARPAAQPALPQLPPPPPLLASGPVRPLMPTIKPAHSIGLSAKMPLPAELAARP